MGYLSPWPGLGYPQARTGAPFPQTRIGVPPWKGLGTSDLGKNLALGYPPVWTDRLMPVKTKRHVGKNSFWNWNIIQTYIRSQINWLLKLERLLATRCDPYWWNSIWCGVLPGACGTEFCKHHSSLHNKQQKGTMTSQMPLGSSHQEQTRRRVVAMTFSSNGSASGYMSHKL